METYFTTASAGEKIAGITNPGVGEPITLSPEQAAYYLRTGELTAEPQKKEPEKPTTKARANVRN